ncbi:hypothetical protein D3C76_1493170 [compost metagenome]
MQMLGIVNPIREKLIHVVHAERLALRRVKAVDLVKNPFDAVHEVCVDYVSNQQYFFAVEMLNQGWLKTSFELPIIADKDVAGGDVVRPP